MSTKLGKPNLIWDKVQLAAFFTQETIIGLLYIRETRSHLKNVALLASNRETTRRVLHHLIYVNIFIIALDCSLIGLCYAGFFFLQGFYKATIYAIKLRTEFTILNQLRSTLPGRSGHESYGAAYVMPSRPAQRPHQNMARQGSQDSDVEMVGMRSGVSQLGEIRVQKDIVVTTTADDGRRTPVSRVHLR